MKNVLNTYTLSELYTVKELLEATIRIAEEIETYQKVKSFFWVELDLVKEAIERKKNINRGAGSGIQAGENQDE